MGIVVLAGKSPSNISGELSTITGDLHVKDENVLAGAVASIEGEFLVDQYNSANIFGWFNTISGSLTAHSSVNVIEGELVNLDLESTIVATSNQVIIESDLLGIEGALYGGGAIEGDFSVLEGELTGTVPSVGRIEHSGVLLEGSMSCGAEINFTSTLLEGSMEASVPSVGRISGEAKLSVLTGSFEAIVPFGADLVGELRTLTGSFTAHTDVSSRVAGTLSRLTGSIHVQTEVSGVIEGEFRALSGHIHAVHSVVGAIEGELASLTPKSSIYDTGVYDYGILRFVRGETR